VVWIDWRGEAAKTWVFVDGNQADAATVSDSVVTAGNSSLALSAPRVLVDRDLGDVLGKLRPLEAVVPATLYSYRESKWTSVATFTTPDRPPRVGRTVHELVRFA
jgi:hypothetical protein